MCYMSSNLDQLQNGCEAMADSLLAFLPHEQSHRALTILKQIETLSPDGTAARCWVETVCACHRLLRCCGSACVGKEPAHGQQMHPRV